MKIWRKKQRNLKEKTKKLKMSTINWYGCLGDPGEMNVFKCLYGTSPFMKTVGEETRWLKQEEG